jgi:hypothetical protein
MNKLPALLAAVLGVLPITQSCFAAAEPDMGECHYTTSSLQSWKDLLARQLKNHDPSHAVQLTKVASAIIDGKTGALRNEINGGISANSSLKLAGGDMSLLELAVAACQDQIARELVTLGASADGEGSSAPLVLAAGKGQGALTEFLITQGASLDKVNFIGHTALEEAVRQHQLGPVQVLLKHGDSPNRPLARGATALDFVAHSSDSTDIAIAEELRSHGGISGKTSDVELPR